MRALFARLTRFVTWKNAIRLTVLGIGVVVLRYYIAVASFYGVTSPLTYTPAVAKQIVTEAIAYDWFRVRVRIDRILDPRAAMQNVNLGMMQLGVTLGDIEATPEPPEAPELEYRTIPGLLSEPWDSRTAVSPAMRPLPHDAWTFPTGEPWGRRRSAAAEITTENVSQLELLHAFDAEEEFGGGWLSSGEATALTADGVVYWVTADERVVAIDLETGDLLWNILLPTRGFTRRGFTLHKSDPQDRGTLFVPFGSFMGAVDAATGKLIRTFGSRGVISIPDASLVAPVVHNDELIVAIYSPPTIAAFDVETGDERWRMPLHPENRNWDGGTPWSGMALDAERNLLFVTTGNPRPAVIGITRPGNNENSNSVIAIDLDDHEIEWAFQEVRHGLWDFDVSAPPMLTSLEIEGRPFEVVVVPTKIGNTLILDRDTGRPIYDFRLRRAPTSTFLHEQTAEFQPDLELPEPFIDIEFDPSEITNIDEESRQSVVRQIEDGRTLWGRFVPPGLNRDMVTFGVHGGAQWHGASIDPESGMMYLAINAIPYAIRIHLQSSTATEAPDLPGRDVYQAKCASCHLPSRDGQFNSVGEVATINIPALHAYTIDQSNRIAFTTEFFENAHSTEPETPETTRADLDALWTLFEEWDRVLLEQQDLELHYTWRKVQDKNGFPASIPPWGKIVAMDLKTGLKAWEVPFGEEEFDGRILEGTENFGGLSTSAGGLIFASGTHDGYLRALDEETGETLWRYRMDAAGSSPPVTIEHEGRQYLIVVATGGRFPHYKEKANKLYVFALPEG